MSLLSSSLFLFVDIVNKDLNFLYFDFICFIRKEKKTLSKASLSLFLFIYTNLSLVGTNTLGFTLLLSLDGLLRRDDGRSTSESGLYIDQHPIFFLYSNHELTARRSGLYLLPRAIKLATDLAV
jgi:hypothetical protein